MQRAICDAALETHSWVLHEKSTTSPGDDVARNFVRWTDALIKDKHLAVLWNRTPQAGLDIFFQPLRLFGLEHALVWYSP